jgi:hypothetical protein
MALRVPDPGSTTLLEVIRWRGAMDKLITDGAAAEISQRVMDVLHHLMIDNWQSEAHFQHQNFTERHWQDLKRLLTTWLMNLWLCCYMEYVANIMNITAGQSLNWQTPLQRLTGQTPYSSIAMVFQFYDEIFFCRDQRAKCPSQTVDLKGCFVRISKHVGHALTYKILTD